MYDSNINRQIMIAQWGAKVFASLPTDFNEARAILAYANMLLDEAMSPGITQSGKRHNRLTEHRPAAQQRET